MSADTFPYRFVATDGPYAGTTFIYPGDGTVISYRTESPTCYFRGRPPTEGWGHWPMRIDMTPEALAGFEAIPLRGVPYYVSEPPASIGEAAISEEKP